MAYAFESRIVPRLLPDRAYQQRWRNTLTAIGELTPVIKQVSPLVPLMLALPRNIIQLIVPPLALVVDMRKVSPPLMPDLPKTDICRLSETVPKES